jgi:glycosyltransferase involved in cell wall biosynthesis
MHMTVLINVANLKGSGVVQVASSFLIELQNLNNDNNYIILIGPKVKEAIENTFFDGRFKFYLFENKPIDILKGGFLNIIKFKKIEKKHDPVVAFSLFGPSWWTPNCPHLQGYAYPHYVYPDSPFFQIISPWEKFIIKLKQEVHFFFLRRNGSYFVSETQDVSERLKKYLKLKNGSFFTVPNTFNNFFNEPQIYEESSETSEFRLLCLCTLQRHKNLSILNELIPILKNRESNFKYNFYITIDKNEIRKILNKDVMDRVTCLGRVQPSSCPQLYKKTDALFLPTLLECFSANYPEAMKMNTPIITSNLSFARNICGDAALYFNPLDANDIADKIESLRISSNLRNKLIQSGKERVIHFGQARNRAEKYLEILNKIK